MKIEDFLEKFNDGSLDIRDYFNDYETWFSILDRKGLLSEIDPLNGHNSGDWQNEYILWLYKSDKTKYYKALDELMTDIIVDQDSKKVYWVGEPEELSNLFCERGRNALSRETISDILSGEHNDYIYDHEIDLDSDVIDNLNKSNLSLLKEKILEELSGNQLDPKTDVMESIAEEQGHPDYWEITSENIEKIMNDSESINSLLDEELDFIGSDLRNIYFDSLNTAYVDELHKLIWKELGDFFHSDEGKWVSFSDPKKKDTTIMEFRLPILDFERVINDYLESYKDHGWYGTVGYYGTFLEVLKEFSDCLSVYSPDYPDYYKQIEYLNENFKDYF